MDYPMRRTVLILGSLLLFTLVLASCAQEPEQVEVTRVVEIPVEGPEVEVTRVVEVTVEVPAEPEEVMPAEPAVVVPFEEEWASSAHADASAEAFVHWDEDDPAEVPPACAKCHSTPGYQDFIGADGSEAGVVDAAAPIGTVVTCEACHGAGGDYFKMPIMKDRAKAIAGGMVEKPGEGCVSCHNEESPTFKEFKFDEMWPKVKHERPKVEG